MREQQAIDKLVRGGNGHDHLYGDIGNDSLIGGDGTDCAECSSVSKDSVVSMTR
ncbi:MAG: hypothetical protein EBE86_031275 [Hormoscilla sp. GUM202]|nr:hypothetical protein [Hormoscilla sp. GUM202]